MICEPPEFTEMLEGCRVELRGDQIHDCVGRKISAQDREREIILARDKVGQAGLAAQPGDKSTAFE